MSLGGDGTNTNIQRLLVYGEEQYEVKKIVVKCGYGSCMKADKRFLDVSYGD